MIRTDEVLLESVLPIYDTEPGERIIYLDENGEPFEIKAGKNQKTFCIPTFEADNHLGYALASKLASVYPEARLMRTVVLPGGKFGAALFGIPT